MGHPSPGSQIAGSLFGESLLSTATFDILDHHVLNVRIRKWVDFSGVVFISPKESLFGYS